MQRRSFRDKGRPEVVGNENGIGLTREGAPDERERQSSPPNPSG